MAGLAVLALLGVAMVLSACGGDSGTSAASAPPATTPPAPTMTQHGGAPTAAPGSKGDKPTQPHVTERSIALHRAALRVSPSMKRGRQAGHQLCAGVKSKDALARFLTIAEAAEKQHHISGRAGMIERIKMVPKRAYGNKEAPALAAALVASGVPLEQRVGAYTGCLAQLQHSG
jgi:hypothetical protein